MTLLIFYHCVGHCSLKTNMFLAVFPDLTTLSWQSLVGQNNTIVFCRLILHHTFYWIMQKLHPSWHLKLNSLLRQLHGKQLIDWGNRVKSDCRKLIKLSFVALVNILPQTGCKWCLKKTATDWLQMVFVCLFSTIFSVIFSSLCFVVIELYMTFAQGLRDSCGIDGVSVLVFTGKS